MAILFVRIFLGAVFSGNFATIFYSAGGGALAIEDVVAGDEDLLESFHARENARLLRRAVEQCLTEQEKQVVCMRYGLFGQMPRRQREVAEILGISRSYVSRIEKRALERLRKELEQAR